MLINITRIMKMYLGICKGYYAKVKMKLTRNLL